MPSGAQIPTTTVSSSSGSASDSPFYSVRVGLGYRALGLREGEHVYWFWIGSHAEYDELLRRL
jgi:hypothetical protein